MFRFTLPSRAALLALLLAGLSASSLAGQAATSDTQQTAPPPSTATTPAPPTNRRPQYPPPNTWQQHQMATFANDFGQLGRYREADQSVTAPAKNERRVIFFGDSITDIWKLDRSFPGKEYLNRGIGGQTTSQMLLRYQQDVLDLQPAVIVILAGTNDIAGNSGAIANKDIENNLAIMAKLARLQNARVIFSSVTPVNNYTDRAKPLFNDRPVERILDLNQWMKHYAEANKGVFYLDYYDAMLDKNGMMVQDISRDGLHPNDAGFDVMAPLAEAAIEKALAQK